MRRIGLVALGIALVAGIACSRHAMIDSALGSAYHPPGSPTGGALATHLAPAPFVLLAGDLHCHVAPPDDPSDVTRGLPATLQLARAQKLDFVVLTPHVGARFFTDEAARTWVSTSQSKLRASIALLGADDVLFVPGFEYTDHAYGHVGTSFGDLDAVLAEVSVEDAKEHPEKFFERWVAHGGLLVINHPLVTPLDSVFAMARADLSWRPFTRKGPFPAEIMAADRLAEGFEAYNVTASHLRDRYLLGDGDHTLRTTLARLDEETLARKRRMTPVGGSDSHGMSLRGTTWVLAHAKTPASIRAAITAGRVCVRSPAACSFEARPKGATAWSPLGSALNASESIEVRAIGKNISIVLDGREVSTPASGAAVTITVPSSRCSVLRARIDEGVSAPIYVNCPFATASP